MPEETAGPEPLSSRRLEVWLPIATVVLDQVTKALVRSLVPLSSSVEVVPGFMNFTHVRQPPWLLRGGRFLHDNRRRVTRFG